MFIMLPDSPVTAKRLTLQQRRIAIERLRGNQTGVENKHLKWYQVREAFTDYKIYVFFLLGVVVNIPNGGISNFGTIIIKGFGFSTLVTTLMQVSFLSSPSAFNPVPVLLLNSYLRKKKGSIWHHHRPQHPHLRIPKRPPHEQEMRLHHHLPPPQHRRLLRPALPVRQPQGRATLMLLSHRSVQRRLRADTELANR